MAGGFFSMHALLFHNALVLTMDPSRPHAEAVAVGDGRIVAAGGEADAARALDSGAQRIDCAGGVLLPAFIDAHIHVLAYAASLRSLDCSAARSIAEIQASIRERAAATPSGAWVRAFGYEETQLAEQRHLNRHDLDAAAPARPVRLIHRGGHASVLNSLALRAAGIGIATEEPPGGYLERELDSGEPSGFVIGMERLIESAVPPLPYDEISSAVREANTRLLRAGIVCVQDATHTNGRAAWELFARLIEDGSLSLDVVLMMEGIERLGELPEQGADGRLRRGPVKIMLHESNGDVVPGEDDLRRAVAEAHGAGRQVAIHAVGEHAVEAAVRAIDAALGERPRADHRHRIEHCGVLPEGMAPRLAQLGVFVVSQPSFVYERGERYLQLIPETQLERLYALRTLSQAGVALAAGSDAPVAPPEPLASAAAAAERRSNAGRPVAPRQAIEAEEALGWWTPGAARAAFLERERGMVRAGLRADLVLLPAGALERPPAELRRLGIERLWRAGLEADLASAESG